MDRQPVTGNRPIPIYRATVALYLESHGVDAEDDPGAVSMFGKDAAALYRAAFGRDPGMVYQLINGHLRSVFCYRYGEIRILDAVWSQSALNLAVEHAELFRSLELIEVGARVDYHGSLESMHGHWEAVPCPCPRCLRADKAADCDTRYALLDPEAEQEGPFHVRRASITPCPADV